ncbi:S8 family serine peptidase [Dokdonella sp.]|uniref:S8 family serine peptidase n=1 Tax=Dokdonella sp. TaxID=2291710 RepID=UPI001B039263|nr:S8 family serine peptidase [Dokdonella sp.]MBO9661905.1 S8 family serine peptidase [Dokdonella sp.]
MVLSRIRYPRLHVRMAAFLLCTGVAASGVASAAAPENLGNGLGKLLESHLATRGLSGSALQGVAPYDGYTTEQVAALARSAISDSQGRYMVRINPDGKVPIAALAADLGAAIPSLQIKAVDAKYRNVGVMDAYVSLDDVAALSGASGVRSVILELKPYHSTRRATGTVASPSSSEANDGDVFRRLGSVFDEGVTQHRVDRIDRFYNAGAASDYEGAGMSIGFLSNSFGANASAMHTDVTNFDLPGAATNPVNTQAVTVLEDDATPGSDDEGRAMVQIGYKMAPKAKLAFATANFGEVDFANNIRALAGIPANQYPGQTFAADTICDDVGYFDEPFFQDGIVSAGVDDATAFGISYFSSAANDIGVNGYDSELRWVPNGTGMTAADGNSALAGTNINLANVPPELYAGGFHNFNPNAGQLDVAQTVNIASGQNQPQTILQWNEPYDQNTAPNLVQPPLFTGHGTITNTQTSVSFTMPASLTAGALYELTSTADSGSSVDSIVTIKDPSGNVLVDHQDTTVDEVARFFAPVTGGNYSVTVDRYGTTTGALTVNLYATNGFNGPAVKTRISLLAFTTAGAYVPASSLTDNNLATNEPIQLGQTPRSGGAQLQYVIARANVPTGPNVATHVRYLIPGNGLGGVGPAEYFTYGTVTTGGHAMAKGTNGTAAYDVFRPNLPEPFTSPGPVRIYYDDSGSGEQFAIPEIRREPRIAAADDAANTVLAPNFSGTSAAAPHAAAIAALVLEAHGGRHALSPAQMTDLLEHSTFPHDLDPWAAAGVARTGSGARIAIRIGSDGSSNAGTGGQDTNAFTVTYTGSGSLATLVFNPQGTATTAGNVSGGENGVADVAGSNPPTVKYSVVDAPGLVFTPNTRAFAVGSQSTLPAGKVTATYSNAAPAPSAANQWWTMTLTFADAAFTQDKVLRYSVGRAEQHSADDHTRTNYLADLFGGGVSIPSGNVVQDGMTFSGTTTDGETFSGVIRNRLGAGYTAADGYGFLDAEAAVQHAVP